MTVASSLGELFPLTTASTRATTAEMGLAWSMRRKRIRTVSGLSLSTELFEVQVFMVATFVK
jgi:hypothetical protein